MDNKLNALEFRPEGGESVLDMRKRAEDFCKLLISENSNTLTNRILSVSHWAFMREFHFVLNEKYDNNILIENCSIHIFEIKNGEIKEIKCNYTKHLN